jgi:tripartite-type tricarboxylate transporter receptor subunit TctC
MSGSTRRTFVLALPAFVVAPTASAQAWPNRPITLVHGFPPGGPVDLLSRILAEALSGRLGQPLVIESRSGATGTIAAADVARAKPDGYTLLSLPTTFATTAAMTRTLPYRPVEDFTFISTAAEYPLLLVTYPDSAIRGVPDIIKLARSRAGPMLFGTGGFGSVQHLSMELFAAKTSIRLQHVPYQGQMPAIADLLEERLDLVLDTPTVLIQLVRSGKLRALAVTGADRFSELPDVPTMTELGLAGLVITGYQGIVGPAKLPDAITLKISGAIAGGLADPTIVKDLKNIGNCAKPSSPDEFRSRVINDISRWRSVIEQAHIAPI